MGQMIVQPTRLEVQQSGPPQYREQDTQVYGLIPTCKEQSFGGHYIVVHRFSREHGIVRIRWLLLERVLNSWIANMASVTPGIEHDFTMGV